MTKLQKVYRVLRTTAKMSREDARYAAPRLLPILIEANT